MCKVVLVLVWLKEVKEVVPEMVVVTGSDGLPPVPRTPSQQGSGSGMEWTNT